MLGRFCIGTILKWGDIDKCGGDIDGGEFSMEPFDQVPFEDVSDEDIELLLEKRDSHSTNNLNNGAVRILQTYCLEKNLYFPYDGTTNADLNTLLTHIFTAVRTKEGKLCCRSVMAYRNISRKC